MSRSSKLEKIGELEFRWGRKKGMSKNKDAFFYESFLYDGVEYALHDSVYMYNGSDMEPYIGKLIKIWEKAELKLVKIHWFFRPSEIAYYLKDEDVLDNELFFASGDGHGIGNVNPLEAIAGKCNIVCISKDHRNHQPTTEELQAADYVFYRVFDVQNYTISDKIEDKVGGLEVKFIFNTKEFLNSLSRIDPLEHASTQQHGNDNLVENVDNEMYIKEPKQVKRKHENLVAESSHEVIDSGKNLETTSQIGSGDKNTRCKISKLDGVKYMRSPNSHDQVENMVKSPRKDDYHEDAAPKRVKHEFKLSQNEVEINSMLDIKANKVLLGANAEDQIGLGKNKEVAEDVSKETPLSRQASGYIEVGNDEKIIKKHDVLEGTLPDATLLMRQQSQVTEEDNACNGKGKFLNVEEGIARERLPGENVFPLSERTSGSLGGKIISSFNEDVREHNHVGIGKSLKFSNEMPMKADIELLNMKSKDASNICHQSKTTVKLEDSCLIERMSVKKVKLNYNGERFEDNEKSIPRKMEKENSSIGSSRKLQAPLKKVDNERLAIRSPNHIGKDKEVGKIFEVTKKDIITKVNWIKLPWEQRLKQAQDEGKLVLLQNLDPEYTSAEVEDIIWHAFDEDCEAKVVQLIVGSNRCYGQAFAIFKTREAANRILRKLDEGCLMLPNERPLVARAGNISKYLDNRMTFFGHLSIDKVRRQILKGTQREGISTSHCSQNNTIEYEMAMGWCLVQSKYDKCLEELFKRQSSELEKLTIKVK